jgi:hypothetical protein
MRKLYILSLLSFFSYVFIACDSDEEIKEDSIITVTSFAEAKPLNISDLVSEQKYVLLSTQEDALFKRVDKMIAKNDRFYLFDHLSESGVLIFDQEGKFIRKVGEVGEGPQQIKGISDFQITDKGEIQILDKIGKSIDIYSAEGLWKEKIAIPINSGGFAQFGEKWFLAINFDNQNESLVQNHVLGVFESNMDLDSLFFRYAKGASNSNVYYNSGVVSTDEESLIYHRPPNDTMSIFSKEGRLKNRLVIDFGEKQLPTEVVNDFQAIDRYKAQEASFQYLQSPTLLAGNRLFGLTSSTKNEIWNFMYSLDSEVLYTDKINLSQLHFKDMIIPSAFRSDNVVISLIEPSSFGIDAKPESYPQEVRNHLENEGYVLLLHYLKP